MGKGRNRQRRRNKKIAKKLAARGDTAPDNVVRLETRDPKTRWRDTTARGTPVQFKSKGPKVPVDLDSDDAPTDLARKSR